MGIFTRVRDIISSNINAMLDKAEDPEKLVKLMIQEMEDTLVEVKASCASAMAIKKRIQRASNELNSKIEEWGRKAELAISKGREDLAREAIVEKRRLRDRFTSLDQEINQADALVEQYQSEITQLEDKLTAAREKQRVLIQRHVHARTKKRVEEGIRKVDTSDAFVRFEHFENRIERMEADANLVNYGRKPKLEDEFAALEDDEVEKELSALKASVKKD